MQAMTSIRVPDTSMTLPPACLLSAAFANPSISTGKERDSESGNDYFGARYYASSMGRFMSPDWSTKIEVVPYSVLSDPQSLNLYAYVLNNPLRAVDPDGHAGCKDTPDLCREVRDAVSSGHSIEDGWDSFKEKAKAAGHAVAHAIDKGATLADDHPIIMAALMLGTNPGSDEIAESALEGDAQELETNIQSVADKASDYFLNPAHSDGGSKANWFEQALGYTKSNMDGLVNQIRFDPKTAIQTGVNEWGTKFNSVINIGGANGKTIPVTFGWILRAGETTVRLTTAIPTKR